MRSQALECKMARQNQDAAKPRTRENDNLRADRPPRPATEPPGKAGSARNKKTLTDPGSGEPTRPG
jgi:hypothetical protein